MSVYLRKFYIKQIITIIIILLFAIIPTYLIYNNFKDQRDQMKSSESLNITFHESGGDKVTLKDVVPVTDSVGLSSRAYTFTIKNNLDVPVKYSVKLLEDLDKINEDNCQTSRIPMQVLKIGYHKNKDTNQILSYTNLIDNTITQDTISGHDKVEYTVRIWVEKGTLTTDNNLHFHGILQVLENGVDIATAVKK